MKAGFPRLSLARAGAFFGLLALVAGGCKGSSGGGTTGPVVGPLATPQMTVAAGEVTETSVLLWANPQSGGDVTFKVSTTSTLDANLQTKTASATSSALIPVKAAFLSLTAATQYYYEASASEGAVTGKFKTLPSSTATSTGLVFGVSGDWRGELAPYPSVRNVPAENLDFFVSLGDNIYSDSASPVLPDKPSADQQFRGVGASTLTEYREKHREVFSERYGLNTLADLRASTAWFATIDDHEIFDNAAGGAPAGSDSRFTTTTGDVFNSDTAQWANGMQSFLEYHPVTEKTYSGTINPPTMSGTDPRLEGKKKLYRTWRYGKDAAFFLLDLRSFRSEEVDGVSQLTPAAVSAFVAASAASADTGGRLRTMVGAQQMLDLQTDLATAQADGVTWKFILSSVPISSLGPFGFGEDRWDGYLLDRAQLLAFINAENFLTGAPTSTGGIENVVFVSADVHGTIVGNVAYTPLGLLATQPPRPVKGCWEITTGPVGFDPGLGESAVDIAFAAGLVNANTKALYEALPFGTQKDQIVQGLLDGLTDNLHQDRVGLDQHVVVSSTLTIARAATSTEVGIDFEPTTDVIAGDPAITVHHEGWTEFAVASDGTLTITTWGIDPYSTAELIADPTGITGRTPRVIQKFQVHPKK